MIGKKREMMGLAKERREIGRQRIRECLPLITALLAFEAIQIRLKGTDAGCAQAPRQPAVHHFLLAFGKRDSSPFVYQCPNPLKVPRRKLELLDCFLLVLLNRSYHSEFLPCLLITVARPATRQYSIYFLRVPGFTADGKAFRAAVFAITGFAGAAATGSAVERYPTRNAPQCLPFT